MAVMTSTSTALKMLPLSLELNVAQRLTNLRTWRADWQDEDSRLCQRLAGLNPARRTDVLLGSQISSWRRQATIQLTQQPISLDPESVKHIGFTALRQHLAPQYARLSRAERELWLTNLYFVLTPTLRSLSEKLDALRRYRRLGQTRCFLLGGLSGVGKSSCLNWYAHHYRPAVESTRNHVPVVKIDAPVSNRSPKPLFLRILAACGATNVRGDEEHYLELVELYFQRCGVELLIVDEVEHITQPGLRRRLLELSNLTGVPIVCASCNPIGWTNGDAEIQGRWNDYFELTPFSGTRLDAFLALLDLLLPFEQDSQLGLREIAAAHERRTTPGPAQYIEEWTDGIFREIMVLVMDASLRALETQQACLSLDLLKQAWRDVKRAKVVNFLDHVRAQKGAHYD